MKIQKIFQISTMKPLLFLCILTLFRSVLTEEETFSKVKQQSLTSTAKSFSRTRSFIPPTTKKPLSFGKTFNEIMDDDPIPTHVWIPAGLDFTCKGRSPGYYTDPSPLSKCQVYHMCMSDGRKYSMLCGIGTIFNQITFVCDHWYNYRCSDAESDYKRNDQLWDQFLSPISSDDDEEFDYEDSPTMKTIDF